MGDFAPAIGSALNRRSALVGSMAAGLAVSAGGAFWLWRLLRQESYATRIGETKEIVLSDGSLVTLNTDSRLLVHYSKTRRQIQLLQGEALFDVAKNKKRPFIVMAGDTQVRAVGTSFTVKLLPQQPVQVLVREGVVEINRPRVPQAPAVQLPANMMAVAPPEAPISTEAVPRIRVTRDLAWREGRLAFDNETLANAAREFERYSDIQIRVSACHQSWKTRPLPACLFPTIPLALRAPPPSLSIFRWKWSIAKSVSRADLLKCDGTNRDFDASFVNTRNRPPQVAYQRGS
jgi:transmembrane sensor